MFRLGRQLAIPVLAALAALAAAPAMAAVAVGAPAPDFTLVDLDGREHSLSGYRGKVVVLEWVNPNCPFSRRHAEQKTMTGLAAAHPEVVWLGINSTARDHRDYLDAAAHKAFNAENGISYPVLYDTDGKIGHAYDAKTTPQMVIVDEAGKVVYDGAIDDDPYDREAAPTNYVALALDAHASGRLADPATTKPYGCSVKYAD